MTASFNIIEDVADIRWGRDMLHKNGCILNMGEEKREVYCTYNYKGRAKNRSILQFCLAFSHQCVYLSSVKRFEAIKCGVIQW